MQQLEFTLGPRKSLNELGLPNSADLTATRAREVLDYDAETGKLTWKVSRGTAKAGKEAGFVWRNRRRSYRKVGIDGVLYNAHRLAFLIYYGAWPSGEIDHLDQNGLNNRISNLRAVPRAVNARNLRQRLDNSSGVTGVHWHREGRKWRAVIKVDGRDIHLGLFDSLAEAAATRKTAERRYNFHENHGKERQAGREAQHD